ncbi:MAG: hypothetical protein JSR85_03585 [Proteobacteria bacterium]|nr:hypothetical protein [Pseudomonadota bacterium]
MIAQQVGATVPSSLPENSTSLTNRSITFEDSRDQFSVISFTNSTEVISDAVISDTHYPTPSPQYFSLDRPIPLENRTALYTAMEDAYRGGEVCEEETFAVIKNLPATHPLQEMLKGCDGINAIYRKPEKLKAMNIAFSDKALSHEYKVVPQHRYAISEDKILFTGNVMKCVAIGIHNPTDERGGLAHVAGENIRYLDAHLQSDGKSKTGFHEFMEKVAGTTKPEELKVTVLSGSKAHIEYYVRFMKAFGIKNFTIIQNDVWGNSKNNFYNKKLSKGSLAIDPSNGRVYRIKNDRAVSEWMGPPFGAPTTAMRLTEEE